MRQSQQNRRSRGRSNNNNRKGQNPLTRSYESNGPDVKIRGTPSHIAEKYVTMARDALSSGDPVLAENYLQHAEHYNRIIMTYREQQVPQTNEHAGGANNGRGRGSSSHDNGDNDAGGNDDQVMRSDAPPPGSEPQPNVTSAEAQPESRPTRRRSSPSRDRGVRSANTDRNSSDAADGERTQEGSTGRGRGRRSRYSQSDDQPEFLKRPVRRPRSSESEEAPEEPAKSDETTE